MFLLATISFSSVLWTQVALAEPIDPLAISTLILYASTTAQESGIDPDLLAKVINCESGWNRDAEGGLGEIGLVQILPKVWKNISELQMRDPYFSIDFIVHEWKEGNERYWTCYRESVDKHVDN